MFLLLWKDWNANKGSMAEKSVVRPTYSYLGDYKLSDKVFVDIVRCVGEEIDGVAEVSRVIAVTVSEGVEVMAVIYMEKGHNIMEAAAELQRRAVKIIEDMTAFNVNCFNVEVKGFSK